MCGVDNNPIKSDGAVNVPSQLLHYSISVEFITIQWHAPATSECPSSWPSSAHYLGRLLIACGVIDQKRPTTPERTLHKIRTSGGLLSLLCKLLARNDLVVGVKCCIALLYGFGERAKWLGGRDVVWKYSLLFLVRSYLCAAYHLPH